MKIIFILLLAVILTGCFITPPPIIEGKYYFFGVGICDYQNTCENDLTAPTYALDSIKELFEKHYNFEVMTVLKDYNASKENVLNTMWYTFKDATKDDVCIFYWAGHGTTNAVLTYDMQYLAVNEIQYFLDKIEAEKIMIIDACHSGSFIEKAVPKLFNEEGYQVITSTVGDDVCYQVGATSFSEPYMVFTKGILEGFNELFFYYLADKNKDKIVTMTEVYDYAVEWVSEYFYKEQNAQIYPEGSQFPMIIY